MGILTTTCFRYTSLDKILDSEPEHLVPSHTQPISGKQNIRDAMIPYRDAIQYVHDQTIRFMNKGETLLSEFLYPPQNEVLGGYTVFSLAVIPSFRDSVTP